MSGGAGGVSRITPSHSADLRAQERALSGGLSLMELGATDAGLICPAGLLALSYDLRGARAGAEAEGDVETASLLAEATGDAHTALGELRDLAQGIHPAILTEAGLAPALTTLAEVAPLAVEIGETAEERYPAAVETVAYVVVAEAIDDAARRGASYAAVSAPRRDERFVVKVEDDGSERSSTMIHLAVASARSAAVSRSGRQRYGRRSRARSRRGRRHAHPAGDRPSSP